MKYATLEDKQAFEKERSWSERDEPKTVWGLLERVEAESGDRPATSFQLTSDPGDPGETLTWREFREKAAQTANLFRSLGIGEGDVVAYLLPNCTEVILTYVAGATAGVVNPINPLLSAEQIAGILKETGAKAVVTLKSFPRSDVAQKTAKAVALAPNVETVIEVDLLRYLSGIKRLIVPLIRPKNPVTHKARVLDFNAEIAKQPTTLTFEDPKTDRIAALFHTGGTTGLPKIAQHRHSGLVYNAWLGRTLLFENTDSMMCPLPMFHVFAAVVAFGSAIGSGCRIVFPTPQGYRGDGVYDNFWKLIERYKTTFVIGVPTAMSRLMQVPVNADISTLSLVFCGSAPLPSELYKRFEEAAGVTICEGYGLTEATCLVGINPPDGVKKIGTIGFAFPYTDIKIMSVETGEPCATGDVGEICVANPGVAVGNTYKDAEKNAHLYWGDYLRTGDLGKLDEDNYVTITGRAKDLIIRGGHNIDPAEIEEVLAGHPDVAFAGAIGQPDDHSGEIPCAYVELVEGASIGHDALLSFARENVAEPAARPRHLEILDELPKTAVGKVFKPDLRRMAITRVLNGALGSVAGNGQVTEVYEDPKRGLVARVSHDQTGGETEIKETLGRFPVTWEWT